MSAVVGQHTLKLALLLNAIDPRVGGVLIRGEKGTAKSTAVRALAAVLPEIDVVEACRFSCDPADPGSWCDECRERREAGRLGRLKRRPDFVDLPVSATEDRLIGTIDLEHAIKQGERRFEPGLLARANRGILYIDEVNLLDDHLVDALLDAAAMGVNTVEREGVAFSHPARFILVGTMNPEEGELRPQLLDRFGLSVTVEGLSDPTDRVEVVKRRRAFEDDPRGFADTWRKPEEELGRSLSVARDRLPKVAVSDDILHLIAGITTQMGVDGHRADLVMARAAAAHAALSGRAEASPADVRIVAPLVLGHRLRRQPFEAPSLDEQRMASVLSAAAPESGEDDERRERPEEGGKPADGRNAAASARLEVPGAAPDPEADPDSVTGAMRLNMDEVRRTQAGRRQESTSADKRGRYTRSEPLRAGADPDIALDATIRAAAPFQSTREGDMAIKIERSDLRNKVRRRRVGASIMFCVDASGSMAASQRMEATKAAVLDLLVDAYQRRDRVGLVSFRGDEAELLLAPTGSVELAQLRLREMPTGGATPLAHGIRRSLEVLEMETRRDDTVVPWLVLVTDGRANVGIDGGLASEDAKRFALRVAESRVNAIVVDTNSGPIGTSVARDLARLAGGEYVKLARMDGATMAGTLRERLIAG
jgi:magnesium chelatase subunit D